MMLEIGAARVTILREMAERPRAFLELLHTTQLDYETLTAILEALLSEVSIGKTSDGFQTLYFLPKNGQE